MPHKQMNISGTDTISTDSERNVVARLLPLKGAKVLELGCGRARWTRTIAEQFSVDSIVATEVDLIQHEKNLQINDLPNVRFCYGGAQEIDLPDASMDVVIMLKSLHHVPVPLMESALSEIHRVLKPGGLAYISEPVYEGGFNEILKLFNDEKIVRQAAFDQLQAAIKKGQFALADEVFFLSESRFADFAEFEQRILFATHLNKEISPDLHQTVRQTFLPHLSEDGAVFYNPQRVDLLSKI